MSTKPGRNDPCHCGSGKKYKNCHLTLDEQHRPTPRSATHLSTSKQGLESDEALKTAGSKLQAHRAEFLRFAEDEKAYATRSHALFAEEAFVPLRFSAQEVGQALKRVGCPLILNATDACVSKLREAILSLASPERRAEFVVALLQQVAAYLTAERYVDACLIHDCAECTVESLGESNPFLFEMFSHGYNALQKERHLQDNAWLRNIGLDPDRLGGMSIEEIDAWVAEQRGDPVRSAQVESLLADPDRRARAFANLESMEADAAHLLDRKDAQGLLLSGEEVARWVPVLNQHLTDSLEGVATEAGEALDRETAQHVIRTAVLPVLADMAKAIFTPERIQQLLTPLDEFRQLLAAEDKSAAACIAGLLVSLKGEKHPDQNYFLTALCFASLRSQMPPGERGSNKT